MLRCACASVVPSIVISVSTSKHDHVSLVSYVKNGLDIFFCLNNSTAGDRSRRASPGGYNAVSAGGAGTEDSEKRRARSRHRQDTRHNASRLWRPFPELEKSPLSPASVKAREFTSSSALLRVVTRCVAGSSGGHCLETPTSHLILVIDTQFPRLGCLCLNLNRLL